jgi:excisionase family DNA binding protein
MDVNNRHREIFNVKEAAQLLGVTVSAIRRWLREGRAPASFRAGRLIRFRRSDIDVWIEQNTKRCSVARKTEGM